MSATRMNENPDPMSKRSGFDGDDYDRDMVRLIRLHNNWEPTKVPRNPQVPEIPEVPRVRKIFCASCRERFPLPEIFIAICDHGYCRTCLAELVERSFENKYPFPPRCCSKPFAIDSIRPFVASDMERAYARKQIEHETHNPIYCSNITCQTFIPPRAIKSDVVHCPVCVERTCAKCKNTAHQGPCPKDEALDEVLHLAEREGWRRCPKCMSMIERESGCNHMMCRCYYEFCFRCGRKWPGHNRPCCPEGIYLEDITALALDIARAACDIAVRVVKNALIKGPPCLDRLWIPLRRLIDKIRVRDDELL
ncbi:hypothetical protein FVEN_g12728 [Fusarium venenatum]|uniref:RBR-type E3 ubiquitin transferase n=1 Tax=Fusarium venenatum TaxID=56646 RepID=A0A2L2T3T9_9HYPO|nr:uncharacterized protein FVRRES_13584 [Fusarium venenatum]KAG8358823.1 hypothetical protein FVEN_g12728 [Fusarium venenatum]KAH6980110.1 hypothetical protein EDB82DRAFT_539764 [Fusarium venenatum]CEI41451.1 unnamed protein product [Fusarium venenatum]